MKINSKLILVAIALLGVISYTSCKKKSEISQQDKAVTEKLVKSPFPNEISKVEINESGIATIKTSNGSAFQKDVRASLTKRRLMLSKLGSHTGDTTIVDVIPVFPPSKLGSRSSISSSESYNEEVSSTWTLTYVRIGGIWTVTIWPATQWIADYQVSALLFDIHPSGNSISFLIQYTYTRNGHSFHTATVPHSRYF